MPSLFTHFAFSKKSFQCVMTRLPSSLCHCGANDATAAVAAAAVTTTGWFLLHAFKKSQLWPLCLAACSCVHAVVSLLLAWIVSFLHFHFDFFCLTACVIAALVNASAAHHFHFMHCGWWCISANTLVLPCHTHFTSRCLLGMLPGNCWCWCGSVGAWELPLV